MSLKITFKPVFNKYLLSQLYCSLHRLSLILDSSRVLEIPPMSERKPFQSLQSLLPCEWEPKGCLSLSRFL